MLTVFIFINEHEIIRTEARRIKGSADKDSQNLYLVDGESSLGHRYGDGAVVLAIKMLKRRLKTERVK